MKIQNKLILDLRASQDEPILYGALFEDAGNKYLDLADQIRAQVLKDSAQKAQAVYPQIPEPV